LHELKEADLRSINTILVDVSGGKICAENRSEIVVGNFSHDLSESDGGDQGLWQRCEEHLAFELVVLVEGGLVDHVVEGVDFVGDHVGQQVARSPSSLVFSPDALELELCVLADDLLNLLDIVGVEGGWVVDVLDHHVL